MRTWPVRRRVARAAGLAFLHGRVEAKHGERLYVWEGMAHRDIKPDQLMLSQGVRMRPRARPRAPLRVCTGRRHRARTRIADRATRHRW